MLYFLGDPIREGVGSSSPPKDLLSFSCYSRLSTWSYVSLTFPSLFKCVVRPLTVYVVGFQSPCPVNSCFRYFGPDEVPGGRPSGRVGGESSVPEVKGVLRPETNGSPNQRI